MTMFTVKYSKGRERSEIVGIFDTFDDAMEMAKQYGATGSGQISGPATIFDIAGHEGNPAYGIWIDES